VIDDDGPGADAGCKKTRPAGAQQVIVMQDEEPPCPSDAQRAHGKEAREVIVIEDSGNEQLQPSIFCKKPRPADEQTPGRKDARAGATSKKPRPASVNCNKSRPAHEQTPGRKARAGATAEQPSSGKDARAGATSKKPSDPLFEALRPMCMRHAQPTQTPLQPFTDVLQLQGFMEDPGLILDHLTDCWNVPKLDAGCCEAAQRRLFS